MLNDSLRSSFNPDQFQKAPTGVQGLDEITNGGIPQRRTTLICGSTGCGKTLFGIEFLVNGAKKFSEPGVFISFEENEEELTKNVASLNVDLAKLAKKNKILVEHVVVEQSENQNSGEYNLEGLFVRLEYAIDIIGAKRVVLDTIDALFSGLNDASIIRSELKRLLQWLKEKNVTTIITAEKGEGTLTRHGVEEYVSDCVILLDHRVKEQISTRRIRIVKYRGSSHGTDEYPFLIDKDGISVFPITSLGLKHQGTKKRIGTGIVELDKMFGGKGYLRNSSIMISGTAGTGKTSIAAAFAIASCKRGERCLYLSFEESPGQLVQNMESVGMNMTPWIEKDLLQIISTRPTFFGLEMHLLDLNKSIKSIKPSTVVIDSLTNLLGQGNVFEIKSILIRMIDLLKTNGITGLFTSLVFGSRDINNDVVGVSALIDTWIVVREVEDEMEKRTRGLYIVKSRGMTHSNDVHKLILSDDGIHLKSINTPNNKISTIKKSK